MENFEPKSLESSQKNEYSPEIGKRVMMAENLYKNMSEDCARRCGKLLENSSKAIANLFEQNPELSDLDLVPTN